MRVTGPGGIDVKRELTFDVKVPGGDIKRVTVAKLARQDRQASRCQQDLLADLIPGRTMVNLSVGPLAAFDVPGLLTQLDRYPYGCAEQTTSRALPLLYANELSAQARHARRRRAQGARAGRDRARARDAGRPPARSASGGRATPTCG